MTDITSWLREQAANDFTCEAKLIEAADEIERLLTANENLRMEVTALLDIADGDKAEIERLRKQYDELYRKWCDREQWH